MPCILSLSLRSLLVSCFIAKDGRSLAGLIVALGARYGVVWMSHVPNPWTLRRVGTYCHCRHALPAGDHLLLCLISPLCIPSTAFLFSPCSAKLEAEPCCDGTKCGATQPTLLFSVCRDPFANHPFPSFHPSIFFSLFPPLPLLRLNHSCSFHPPLQDVSN